MTTSVATEGLTVTVLQSALKPALDRVARIASTRTTLPATAMVLVTADADGLTLATTNLEQAMVCTVGAKTDAPGRVLVPAKLFADLIARLPDDKVQLTLTGKALVIKCARSVLRLQTMDASEFPPFPQPKGEVAAITVDAATLRDSLKRVRVAVASDESRPVLATVFFEAPGNNTLTLVAADGFRLAADTITAQVAAGNWLLPLPAVNALVALLGGAEGNIALYMDGRVMQVTVEHSTLARTTLTAQLTAGTYPNWRQLVPKTYTARMVPNTGDLAQAVRTALVMGSDIVRLVPTLDDATGIAAITVSGRSEEHGDGASSVDAAAEGELVRIAVNGRYLLDALEAVTAPKVALELTATSAAAVVRPVGDDRYVHVVMPMFVQWED